MVIELRGVDSSYPDGTAPAGRSSSIARDERVELLGPNGAGKTTLALHLNGVLTQESARRGVGAWSAPRCAIRRQVGMVFRSTINRSCPRWPRMSPSVRPTSGAARRSRSGQRALDAVGMGAVAQRAPHHLSFGQWRRDDRHGVEHGSEILVLDEPSSNLDPASRRGELAEVPESWTSAMLMVRERPVVRLAVAPAQRRLSGSDPFTGSTHELLTDADCCWPVSAGVAVRGDSAH